MEHTPASADPQAGWYEIRLDGRLDDRWAARFDGLHLEPGAGRTTVLRGHVPDQAALHGVLAGVRDVGLPLISVTRVDPDPGEEPTHATNGD